MMNIHNHRESHPQAGKKVMVQFKGGHPHIEGSRDNLQVAVVEDWVDLVMGKSWMVLEGNPAAMVYAIRVGINDIPVNDEVVYAKVGPFGHLIHASELRLDAEVPSEPAVGQGHNTYRGY